MPGPDTFQGQMILLGTGTSVGVPMIGCHCEVCRSTDPRNQRTRCGVAVVAPEGTFLIDTPPELRLQLVREEIDLVHAALFTHDHADHIFGLDDLRIFGQYLDQAVPLYCEESVETQIRRAFHYAFSPPHPNAHAGATPRLSFQRIDSTPFQLLGLEVVPIRLWHGQLPVFGFRIGNVAYCTDVSRIPDESLPLLEDLDVLILDALRERPHPTHFSVEQSLEVIKAVQPRRAYLTHISHFLDHQSTSDALPDHVELAHDGLRIPLALPDVPRIPEAPQRQQWRTLVYLALAQRSHTRGPWPARDRLLLLAATAAAASYSVRIPDTSSENIPVLKRHWNILNTNRSIVSYSDSAHSNVLSGYCSSSRLIYHCFPAKGPARRSTPSWTRSMTSDQRGRGTPNFSKR